ncbi:MAG: phosphate acetyltransferase [Desulfovibrio sp.]|jgi:phosphate acetyltransferase|nr:phosphate acetyltransferase [Desulfovibrio sp.]
MARKLYITATECNSEKTPIVLGMMQMLVRRIRKPAFFRPLIASPEPPAVRDHSINLILSHFGLQVPYEAAYGLTLHEAMEMMNSGRHAAMLEIILQKFKALDHNYDFILCEGTDFTTHDAAFEFELNTEIAVNLGAPVIVICNALRKDAEDIISSAHLTLDLLSEKNLDVAACIVNRASIAKDDELKVRKAIQEHSHAQVPPVAYVLPEELYLHMPTVADVKNWLDADVVYGEDRLDALVTDYLIAAMQVGNFLDYLQPGCLIITPGDREDIVIAGLASRLSSAYPDIAGIVLTGNLELPSSVRKLIDSWAGTSLPVLTVRENTSRTMQSLAGRKGRIEADNAQKINTAIGLFEAGVDAAELESHITSLGSLSVAKITPKMFEYNLLERAAARKMDIVLPEGTEERILRAADILVRRRVARLILLGNIKDIKEKMSALGINPEVTLIQPELSPKFEEYAETYYEIRKKKGVRLDQARNVLSDPTYYGTMMVYKNDAHGMVSGSVNTTAHTVRPAFEIIKTKPGASIVSSVFLMCLNDRVLVFGDCAVNPNPTSEQLADIAINSAHTASIFGIEPRVAMLSYSTGSSGKGAAVDIVIEAVKIAQAKAPELALEGPLQYDAAIDPEVARAKLPDSKVAGRATVFIFPDLNTGNNTYKAVQRAANAVAIGPVLQGLNKPVNDLSRGCTVPDIVNTVAITAVQAQAELSSSGEISKPRP